jgi:hypothetical protein
VGIPSRVNRFLTDAVDSFSFGFGNRGLYLSGFPLVNPPIGQAFSFRALDRLDRTGDPSLPENFRASCANRQQTHVRTEREIKPRENLRMKLTWLLVAVVIGTSGGLSVTSHPFASEDACNQALVWLTQAGEHTGRLGDKIDAKCIKDAPAK